MSRRPELWLPVLAKLWPATWKGARLVHRLARVPLLGGLARRVALPMFSSENLNVSYVPIGEAASGGGSSLLTREIVASLVRASSHRVIIGKCTCRDAKGCANHPADYGCIQLGEGTRQIDPRIARHVSVEECLEHLDRAVAEGLIPMVGRVRIDDLLWGVKPEGRLLAVCLCCRCCCTIMNSGKYWPKEAADSIHRLAGLRVVHEPALCSGCGACAAECFMKAIANTEAGPCIDESRCKGCGRCVALCPKGALKAVCEDPEAAAAELVERVRGLARVD
ncbi:MAG TPA: 4Fe-4S binding protein [Spirochaetales bacterium]|nr:4Fe-4S binding protein [Spirochaetales bacterium]HRY54046.1 4Fe-4S binding protein [Spirochaetia bacterium]HRZ63426.1 4Fe-4S binding protein [Spirochaetia bacterium]